MMFGALMERLPARLAQMGVAWPALSTPPRSPVAETGEASEKAKNEAIKSAAWRHYRATGEDYDARERIEAREALYAALNLPTILRATESDRWCRWVDVAAETRCTQCDAVWDGGAVNVSCPALLSPPRGPVAETGEASEKADTWGAQPDDKDDPNWGRVCGLCKAPIRTGERYSHDCEQLRAVRANGPSATPIALPPVSPPRTEPSAPVPPNVVRDRALVRIGATADALGDEHVDDLVRLVDRALAQ
jgi:hypothetical protein